MALDFTTAAGAPTNVINSEQKQIILFGTTSTSHTSATFPVDQQPYFLSAFNLGVDDTITVQQVFGQGSGTEVSSFAPIFGPVVLSKNRTKCRIDHPGRYQLLHAGSSVLGTFTVVGAAGTMSHDAISDLAEALYASISQTKVYVTSNNPIVTTGTGILGDPYVLSTPDIVVQPSTISPILIGHGATSAPVSFYSVALGIGASSGFLNNVVIGSNSSVGNTSSYSTAVGRHAVITASNSVSVGGTSTAISSNGTAVGYAAIASGVGSVAIGAGAGSTRHGDHNISIGLGAGTTTQPTGFVRNICIGEGATLEDIVPPTAGNIIIGSTRIDPNTDSNVVIGDNAAKQVPNLANAVVIGGNALNNLNGSNSTAVGYNAGSNNFTTNIGTNSLFVGCQAGFNSSVGGVFLGCNAGNGETHSSCIIINDTSGNNLNATQNNQIVLGTSTQTQLVTAGSIIQGGVISASDERLKKNVEAEWEALEVVQKLTPITFEWDENELKKSNIPINEDELNKRQHGLIAQEVEEILPELVENIDRGAGEYKFVRYERLIPILLAAIQELKQRVDDLERIHE